MSEQLVKVEDRSIYASVESFEAAQRMAKSLCASDFVPDGFRNNLPNTLIAIEIAGRYGALNNPPSVLAVMQNLYVVHGKPAFEAKFVIGLVNTCGRFGPMEWNFVGEPGSTVWGARAVVRDLKRDKVLTGTLVDMEMVKREGWLDKKGSKWKSMPEQMLKYRSASFWVKTHCPELLLGMYTIDELEDSGDLDTYREKDETRDDLEVIAERLTEEEAR